MPHAQCVRCNYSRKWGAWEGKKEGRKEGATALVYRRLNSQAEVQSYRVLALQKGDQNDIMFM